MWRHPARTLGLLLSLVGGGCLVPAAVTCEDGTVCPGEQVCTATGGLCVEIDQAAACDGLDDGAPCDWPTPGAGICRHGACFVPVCGDGELDPGEVCDDGNVVSGDGCAAGCGSDETCGNGAIDAGEACDDGNQADGDGCQAGCVAPRCGDGILDAVIGETCDDGNAINHDDCSRTCARERLLWTERNVAPDTGLARLAVDARRGVVVLFGGRAGESIGDQTWEWDGATWAQRRPAVVPPARGLTTLAYDPVRQQTLMFSGDSPDGPLADFWAWDGAQWTELLPPALPPARTSAAMAWDPTEQRVILAGGYYDFGGFYQDNYLADVWAWDGEAWTELPERALPAGRLNADLVYDLSRSQLLLCGGFAPAVDDPEVIGWDGDAWTTVAPSSALYTDDHYAYDAARGVLSALAAGIRRDLVDGAWQVVSVGEGPTPGATVVYDAPRGQLVARGQFDGQVWRFGSGTWTRAPQLTDGPALEFAVTAYDAGRGEVVMFGGYDDGGESGTTWVWDGVRWTSTSGGPSARYGAAIGYDSTHARVVLFGGGLNSTQPRGDTWLWDGGSWQERTPATSPSPREGAVIVDDPSGGGVLLLGGKPSLGTASDEVWRWDGTTWSGVDAAMPAGRGFVGVARDAASGDVVVFGGYDGGFVPQRSTWRFDGAAWHVVDAEASPGARSVGLTWDPISAEVQLIGGAGDAGTLELWTFEDDAWRRRTQPTAPPQRGYGVAARFEARGETLLISGRSPIDATLYPDVWALRYESDAVDEACTGYSDTDGDGAVGCADADCAGACRACGDGTCEGRETCWLCPEDCGACDEVCGDGVCSGAETPATCAADCVA